MASKDLLSIHRSLIAAHEADEPGGAASDFQALRNAYRFVRTEEDDRGLEPWQLELAHRYYAKLFREYVIVDLSRRKEGKLGCRWRTQDEVVNGKGQFICGSKGCEEKLGLSTSEIPFSYKEDGKQKHALVKVRLCHEHLDQLNEKTLKKDLKRKKAGGNDALDSAARESVKTPESPRASKKRKLDGAQGRFSSSARETAQRDADVFLAQLLL